MEINAEGEVVPMNITKLDDDSLLHILDFLNANDILVAEKVCKRWEYLISFLWRKYKTLSLGRSSWKIPFNSEANPMDKFALQKVILRYAKYITTVDLSNSFPTFFDRKISVEFLCDVLQHTKRIKCLYLTGVFRQNVMEESNLGMFLKLYARQLIKFGYGYHYRMLADNALCQLLSTMKNLRHFYIDSIADEEMLKYLPIETIEEVIMENCGRVKLDGFSDIFQKATKLHTLCASGIKADTKMRLPENASLKNLGLCMLHSKHNSNWSRSIQQLINIEKLNVEQNDNIDDRFIIALVKNCRNVSFLNISGCNRVTDVGIGFLQLLPKLKHLGIAGLSTVTGVHLGTLPNLEVLNCKKSIEMTNESLIRIVFYSPFLRLINLSSCYLINNYFLEIAAQVVEKRASGKTLHLAVAFTEIEQKMVKFNSNLLKIVPTILHRVECTSNYNGYFPTINDYYAFYMPYYNRYQDIDTYKRIIIE